jgi:Uma2 family endonuclease
MDPVTTLPWGRELTYDDLESMPDDGHRYELIDGVLLVSPSPRANHQRAVGGLYRVLWAARPNADFSVFVAPFDVVLAPDSVIIPDVLVAAQADVAERNLPAPPLLAIEVLSASTRRIDLVLKWSRLEAAGCPSYWVVDPDEPRLIAWELRDGAYFEVADVAGSDPFHAETPFPVTIVPNDLVADA